MSLVELAERDTKLVSISKTQQVEILRGQVMVDNTQLAKLWNKDRKTVPKIIEAMESLGISSSQKVGENRIHTLHSLSGWYVNGQFYGNSFAQKRYAEKNAITNKDGCVSPQHSNNFPIGNEDKVSSADAVVSQPTP